MKIKLLIVLSVCFGIVRSQNISTIGGNGVPVFSGDSVQATTTGLSQPMFIALDGSGNIYVADAGNNRIRKIDAVSGLITTIAGTGVGGYNGDSIPADSAQLFYPTGIALDDSGNIFIADYDNHRVRKIDTAGIISTVAGTGSNGFNGDGIPAVTATLDHPVRVAIDTAGNLYVVDMGNNRVRMIDTAGIITSVAGNGSPGYSGDNILAISSSLYSPCDVAVDDSGNIFIADRDNNRIRRVDTAGIITTVAGNGVAGFNGNNILATAARLNHPYGISLDTSGNLYIADELNNRIRRVIDSTGKIFTLAGTGTYGFSGDGGAAVSAKLAGPRAVALDDCGNIYFSDYANQRIRKVVSFIVSTSAVNASCHGTCNGIVTAAVVGGVPPYTYAWDNGLLPNAVDSNVCAGIYRVIVSDSLGCSQSATVSVTEPSAITFSFTVVNAKCDSSGYIIASIAGGLPPYSLLWSNGDTLLSDSSLVAGLYSLTVTDTNNCFVTDSVIVGSDPASPDTLPVCLVSVDSTSNSNVIVWDKPALQGNLDSFRVYRFITSAYVPVVTLPFSAVSSFNDTTNGVDPDFQSYQYVITSVDTCGNESAKSPFHRTIWQAKPFYNDTGSFTLSWTDYIGFSFSYYYILRDGNNTGTWVVIDSVLEAALNQYTDTTAPSDSVRYRIGVIRAGGCMAGNNLSLSNTSDNFTGVHEIVLSDLFSIFPNPGKGVFNVTLPENGNIQVNNWEILSVYGDRLPASVNASGNTAVIDLGETTPGVYFLRMQTNKGMAVKKLITGGK